MNKWMKKLTAALCAAVLMCGMAVTAYAGGGDMGYPAKSEDFVGRGGATEQMSFCRSTAKRIVRSLRRRSDRCHLS